MWNVVEGLLFVGTQVLLLSLLFSPLLCRERSATPRSGNTIQLRWLAFVTVIAITVATAAFNIAGLNTISADSSRNLEPVVAGGAVPRTLIEKIYQGNPFMLRLDEEACVVFNLGDLVCGDDYQGRYDPRTRRWTFRGRSKRDATEITQGYTTPTAEPSQLTVWGMLFGFRKDGILTYIGGQGVGTIRSEGASQASTAAPPASSGSHRSAD